MSTHANEGTVVPELTLGWRLRLALEHGGVGAQEMADYLGKSRQTLTRWTHDQGARPSRAFILQWAVRTGVDAAWLETGKTPTGPEPDGGLKVERARRDSNSQPSDPKVLPLRRVA